jgi:formylmethanofuran:tetrahydromethanopterin formyltransferase
MHLIDLLPEESLALVALSRAIARADGTITPLEGRAIALMAAELGEATYRKLFAQAAASFPHQAALKEFLASIERPEARSLIYESILALAAADSISPEEEPLMVWLQEAWEIQ